VIPIGIPMDWLPEEFRFVVDEGLTAADLDTFDAVLTGATVAIAETGTVVLQNVPYRWCLTIIYA
jgi:L-lactate dehydrogenase complex protein LldG